MNAVLAPAGLPDYGRGDFRPFRLQPSARRPGTARLSGDWALRLSPALQASPLTRRLAHPRRPNRVYVSRCVGTLLRTGRSRSVALHPVLPRRSYGSIPHGSSPQGNGLPPFCLPAFSGARVGAASASGSDIVLVRGGNYNEPQTITKALTIRATRGSALIGKP